MMKMNGYSLPAQLFSVKKNSSLTRVEISLSGRAAVSAGIQNVQIGRPGLATPAVTTSQTPSAKQLSTHQSAATCGSASLTG